MSDYSPLIEHAFPLKQASLDSVHEKNVRHGHISTLHIWPARRPLAASRAALLATLLPDPGTPEARKALCERIGGKLQPRREQKKMPSGEIVERMREETIGGILHWGLETEHLAEIERFRAEIRQAFGGRAPKVLDPFAGGGAIPLEAMRLGCEVTAIDLNPVAWFLLNVLLSIPKLSLAGSCPFQPSFSITMISWKPITRLFLPRLLASVNEPKPKRRALLSCQGSMPRRPRQSSLRLISVGSFEPGVPGCSTMPEKNSLSIIRPMRTLSHSLLPRKNSGTAWFPIPMTPGAMFRAARCHEPARRGKAQCGL